MEQYRRARAQGIEREQMELDETVRQILEQSSPEEAESNAIFLETLDMIKKL